MAKYYYLDSERVQRGPVEASELIGLGVGRSTLVWTEGMADWVQAGSVEELAPLFTTTPPPSYQAQPQPAQAQAPVNYVHTNWLVWSILVLILCCNPFAIVAIVFSANANSAYSAGKIEEAQRANSQAKMWFWISFGLGVLGVIISTIFYYAAIMASIGMGSMYY